MIPATKTDIRRARRRARATIVVGAALPFLVWLAPAPPIWPGLVLLVVWANSCLLVLSGLNELRFLEELEERVKRISDCSGEPDIERTRELLEAERRMEERQRARAARSSARRRSRLPADR